MSASASAVPSSATWRVRLLAVAVLLPVLETISCSGAALYNQTDPYLPILSSSDLIATHVEFTRTLLEQRERREQLHDVYGWSYRAGFAAGADTLNDIGLRSSRNYSTDPLPGTPRIAAFGDSFVYCNEVSNGDCWTAIIESAWQAEVLNYGVGGYGTDQSWLRYQHEGARLQPSTVLIGFAPVNIRRIVNRYRGFLSPLEGPYFKPRFIEREGDLALLPAPVSTRAEAEALVAQPGSIVSFGRHDYWYEPAFYEHALYAVSPTYRLAAHLRMQVRRRYLGPQRLFENDVFRTETEAFSVQSIVLERFAEDVAQAGARPVFLMLPSLGDVARWTRGLPPSYSPLAERLGNGPHQIIDPLNALAEHPELASLFAPGGHYSAEGNRLVATHIASVLGLVPKS